MWHRRYGRSVMDCDNPGCDSRCLWVLLGSMYGIGAMEEVTWMAVAPVIQGAMTDVLWCSCVPETGGLGKRAILRGFPYDARRGGGVDLVITYLDARFFPCLLRNNLDLIAEATLAIATSVELHLLWSRGRQNHRRPKVQ
ncbi:hypothetical protein BHE74_00042641 [Ensete ventricosum]|nr:hypothetical protein BHE74_00042641 [Ensete ventricosum]RZS16934.1 hypothetical protein BHM03_00049010 [Ensete ventricosum]